MKDISTRLYAVNAQFCMSCNLHQDDCSSLRKNTENPCCYRCSHLMVTNEAMVPSDG